MVGAVRGDQRPLGSSIEQLGRPNPLLLKCFHDRFAAAPGEAMKEDRRSSQGDTQGWYAVFVGGAAAHPAPAPPYAVQSFDNVLRTAFKPICLS